MDEISPLDICGEPVVFIAGQLHPACRPPSGAVWEWVPPPHPPHIHDADPRAIPAGRGARAAGVTRVFQLLRQPGRLLHQPGQVWEVNLGYKAWDICIRHLWWVPSSFCNKVRPKIINPVFWATRPYLSEPADPRLFSSPEHEVLSELLWSFNVRRPSSVVHACLHASTISLNNISSETAYWILTKLHRNDPWVVPYQSCSNRSSWLHK